MDGDKNGQVRAASSHKSFFTKRADSQLEQVIFSQVVYFRV